MECMDIVSFRVFSACIEPFYSFLKPAATTARQYNSFVQVFNRYTRINTHVRTQMRAQTEDVPTLILYVRIDCVLCHTGVNWDHKLSKYVGSSRPSREPINTMPLTVEEPAGLRRHLNFTETARTKRTTPKILTYTHI